ncbi:uncharacterized protein LOC127243424 [Andrographis paniculata]|uniref:uncharacterized protein LOC127243424 n=1 Tax=Andrographis paniculata TaxID=175694 RepID=UPI0021E77138|nr:uncharacterized protein LOC127243424 [Andrographis paniculata]XP_051119388.1 uncharacterized protein LOC127243424 [Andrographis paniculata]XP_051119389.1 uncharacterized protein LOC127243424 [Andrographis paniculata]XP_051119390.1 uncharacterized protein LOC127243424 [Andrographis paniculata]XP_051119391.1 uncharacterized protein LOC127243424 [Andrographis paniculata]XP_051119392.1 uncharacterized protein LOC127243424 [Andrographis paniculata]
MRTKKTPKSDSKAPKSREKKVYPLPGQKHDVPEEREPLRIFYGSLSQQIPSSEMAEFWLMEHGLLPMGRAKKAFEKKQQKQKQLRANLSLCATKSEFKEPTNLKNAREKAQKSSSSDDSDKSDNNDEEEEEDDDHENDDEVLCQKRRKTSS